MLTALSTISLLSTVDLPIRITAADRAGLPLIALDSAMNSLSSVVASAFCFLERSYPIQAGRQDGLC